MRVRFDVHRQPPASRIPTETEIVNVEAVLPGALPAAAARRVYFVAHYDSRATDVLDAVSDAPGANDDGSGVAALIEIARVLSTRRFDATIVLLAVAGEEQGLFGSRLHAAAARAANADITAVLSNDIVGDPSGPDGASSRDAIRVFSEGLPRAAPLDEARRIASLGGESDSPSRGLARFVAEVAALHHTRVQPRLVFRSDRFLRGGDHLAFNEQGYAAVRFTDVFEKYDRQHQDVRTDGTRRFGDLPEFVDAEYLADVARLDAAALIHLANAPVAPKDVRIVTADLTTSTTLRWSRSPEPDVAGYEIVGRATTSAVWEFTRDVGDTTEATLPLSKDDRLFGVRAYDRDGWRGLVVFPAAARE
jgi:Zn-dependent M28 family amino/carboxypeptidase